MSKDEYGQRIHIKHAFSIEELDILIEALTVFGQDGARAGIAISDMEGNILGPNDLDVTECREMMENGEAKPVVVPRIKPFNRHDRQIVRRLIKIARDAFTHADFKMTVDKDMAEEKIAKESINDVIDKFYELFRKEDGK